MKKLLPATLLFIASQQAQAGDKLIGTAAVNHIEGSAGGGLIPYAVLSGYATNTQTGAAVFASQARVDDFSLNAIGFAYTWHDRLELSYSDMTFDIDAASLDIPMTVIGAKVRLFGDIVYNPMGQWSAGLQYKKLDDFTVPQSVGARKDSGTDFYISGAKVWLDGMFNRSVVANVNLRMSKANQIGFLGFGGDQGNSYKASLEGALGVFINRNWLVGTEFRSKRDQLTAVKEQGWQDIFVVYFPNKSLSITAAYLDLGSIAGSSKQTGFYVSVQGSF